MAGLPVVKLELDDAAGSGTFPYDITAWWDRGAGWSLERGQANEFTSIDPSMLRVTLNNNDGRFSPGSAAYGIVDDQRIRLTETTGGVPRTRFTGYVQSWPVSWSSPMATESLMSITAVDRSSRLARRVLPAGLAAEQLVDAPLFQYSLSEAAGATTFGDTSGKGARPLRLTGTGANPVSGVDVGVDQTAVTFTGGKSLLNPTGSTYGSVQGFEVAFLANMPAITIGGLYLSSADQSNPVDMYVYLDTSGVLYGQFERVGSAGISSNVVVTDGQVHLAAVTWVGTTVTLYLDGAVVGSTTATTAPAVFDRLTVGNIYGTTGTQLTVFGIAGYATAPSTARLQAHYAALGIAPSGESSTARLTRLATYAGLTSTDLALEAGVLTNTAGQMVAGARLLDAMDQVVTAEGGTLYVRSDGRLVMQNRYHRTSRATTAASVTLGSGDYEHEDLVLEEDRQFLQNRVTATRVNGAVQTAVNAASVAAFDQYPADLNDLLVTTDAEANDRAKWQVAAYGLPRLRMSAITVDLLTQTLAMQQALMALTLSNRIAVSGLPSQSPVATADLLVLGFSERQSTNTWSITFNTVPAVLFQAWVLGDTTFGVLGSTTKLFY